MNPPVHHSSVPQKILPRSYYFLKFTEFLDRCGISYAVVGDTSKYPDRIESDVDIVIGSEKSINIPQLVQRFAVEEKLLLVQILRHEITSYYCVISWDGSDRRSSYLFLDICTDYYFRGNKIFSAFEIIEGRLSSRAIKKTAQFFVPNHDKEFIYYLIKKINKCDLNLDNTMHLSEEWNGNPIGCSKQLRRYFGQKHIELIENAMISKDLSLLVQALPGLKKELAARDMFSCAYFFLELLRKAGRIRLATGLHVVFLGPDGCGKSSVIEHIVSELAPAFRKTAVVHLRPGIGLSSKKNAMAITDPHARPPRSWLGSLAKLLYLLLDYVAGYLFKIRPMLTRSTLVVFDRYYHDLLVDPKRFRYGGPMWLAQMCGRAVPAPDMVVLLDASAEMIQSRKKEVSYEETARQRKAYLKFLGSMKNAVVIDASQSLPQVVQSTNEKILEFMAQRVKKRY